MTVICSYFDVSVLSDPDLYEQAMQELPWEERREKAMRYRRAEDRYLSLGAGLLLMHMLKEAGVEDLRLRYSEKGKPELLVPCGIRFSLSHSGHIAVCAVCEEAVGADVELLRDAYPALMKRIFQQEEQEWIRQADDPRRAFMRLWTRKESFLKMTGEGLSRSCTSFSVLPEQQRDDIRFAETETDGHMICVCCEKDQEVIFRRWQYISAE